MAEDADDDRADQKDLGASPGDRSLDDIVGEPAGGGTEADQTHAERILLGKRESGKEHPRQR